MAARRRRGRGRGWALLAWIAATIVAAAGWSELFSKPARFYRDHQHDAGLLWTELLKRDGQVYDGFWEGPLFLLLSLALLCMILVLASRLLRAINNYIDSSQVDISMLETRIEVYIEDAAMTRATVHRSQVFHANSSDVEAYHYSHLPENGEVDHPAVQLTTTIAGQRVTRDLVTRRLGRGIEITERFDQPLPVNLLATYLPDQWVLAAFKQLKLFRKVIATRTARLVNINEYCSEKPLFQLQSLRYPVANVEISVNFPAATAPAPDDVQCFRIRENAVQQITPEVDDRGGRRAFRLSVHEVYQERVRIQWDNAALRRHLAGPAPPRVP